MFTRLLSLSRANQSCECKLLHVQSYREVTVCIVYRCVSTAVRASVERLWPLLLTERGDAAH